ncbi:pimeloyl-[acyl-carrier protein] methyl ester esterase [Methylomarinovum tepidoasis]|uniref:Pimeloyl-[acyl-carrier protein] methyl ester esterase n=1 Tax=Methylomarinovum tepidoasis TaxID=2840183 RepID=A0AAU9CXC1_9GAMM|nr:alpha/beta fold hydrolase [Methylomarinovum sp. IN45]BCX89320.1 pimeloyl-[acyl-carrier protein] methyl ester esterase [Methylomarinovum sp. IN45]
MIRLAVRRVGCGPPLVLLPGWAMHSGVWGALVEDLAPHFQLLLVDLPPIYRADAAPALIAALAEQVPAAGWLGWSLGGQLALQVARRHPERVTGLVLVASNPRFLAAPDWPGMAAVALSDLERRVREDPVRALRRFLALVAKGGPAARSLTQLWRQRPPPPLETLLAGLSWLREWDLRAALPQLSCPTLWLGSGDDALVPAAAMRAAARLSGGRWLEVNGGHAPFLADPAPMAAAIRDVLT